MVSVSGKADTQDVLLDDVFGVSAPALRLKRTVEVYQTVEHSETKYEKRGDKTVEKTTYTYSNEWCGKPVDSSQYHDAAKRAANPPAAMPSPAAPIRKSLLEQPVCLFVSILTPFKSISLERI